MIDKKMRELNNIYKMYQETAGKTRAMWCDKWYEMVRNIAAEIRREGIMEARLRRNKGRVN